MARPMSPEGRALLLRLHPRKTMPSAIMFDVLATLEHDLREANAGKRVLLSDWTEWLKGGEDRRTAFVRAVFLLIAASGLTSADLHALRVELASVSPRGRRQVTILHGPRERTAKGLF